MSLLTLAGFTAAAAAVALAVGHAVVESRAFAAAVRRSGAAPLDTAPRDILWLASALAVLALEVAAVVEATLWTEPSLLRAGLAAAGTLAGVLGIGLRATAIGRLGTVFAEPPRHARPEVLLTAGVFGIVRHPSELGLLLMSAGFAAIAAGFVTIALLVALLLPLTAIRIGREEAMLRERFGAAHAAFCCSTPLLWPTRSDWPRLIREIRDGVKER
jgi:protein-S-isoprenylcysteine O-methyltransferase Ste14